MKSFVITVLLTLSMSVNAEVKHVDPHGFIVENILTTTLSADAVWQGLTQHVDQWWPKDHSWWYGTFTIEPQAGGCFCETKDDKSAEHMRIVFVDPHKTLRMTGGLGPLQGMGMYGALDWVLTEVESGTQVTLTYRVQGINPDGFEQLAPIVGHVQGLQLQALGSFLTESNGQ